MQFIIGLKTGILVVQKMFGVGKKMIFHSN